MGRHEWIRHCIYGWICAVLAIAGSVHAGTADPGFSSPPALTTDRIIVKYRTARSGAALTARDQSVAGLAANYGHKLQRLRRGAQGEDIFRLQSKLPVAEVQRLAGAIAKGDPEVLYAEPDHILTAQLIPNDPRYGEQWHYFEAAGGINVPGAWDLSTGAGVTVAVIDTGYRPHADLAPNIVGGYDFISDTFVSRDGDGRDGDASDPGDFFAANECGFGVPARDSSWHGTHVAGTIAALTNNGASVAGVAFNARVVPVRVLGRCGGYTADIADGLIWAAGGAVPGVPNNPNPARVANLSLGGRTPCGSTMQNAVNAARANGTVVVVAAGNSNEDASLHQPASCAGVVTVAAVDRTGGRAYYSNFGAVVEIAAPGGDVRASAANGVLSTLNSGLSTPGGDALAFYQGTSMATPHVAGVVALMLSRNPTLSPDQVLATLQQTSRGFPAACAQCGSGIVNAHTAVLAVQPPDIAAIQAVINALLLDDD